jgi:hypothetical protein
MPRPFYLIGHNPNKVDEAVRCLADGANGLEPDVCYDSDTNSFSVHEQLPLLPKLLSKWLYGAVPLTDYLERVADYLAHTPSANLALLAFDLKEPYNYDINLLLAVVKSHFSNRYPGVSILTTVSTSEGMQFLARAAAQRPNDLVGVDEYQAPDDVFGFFQATGLRYTYANGTSVPLIATTRYVADISRALVLRNSNPTTGPKLVYAWTVNSEASMRTYLDMDVDGLITDNIPALLKLLKTDYADRYTLATPVTKTLTPTDPSIRPAPASSPSSNTMPLP